MKVFIVPLSINGEIICESEIAALATKILNESEYDLPDKKRVFFGDQDLCDAANELSWKVKNQSKSSYLFGLCSSAEKSVKLIDKLLAANILEYVIFGCYDSFCKSFPEQYCKIKVIPIDSEKITYLEDCRVSRGTVIIIDIPLTV